MIFEFNSDIRINRISWTESVKILWNNLCHDTLWFILYCLHLKWKKKKVQKFSFFVIFTIASFYEKKFCQFFSFSLLFFSFRSHTSVILIQLFPLFECTVLWNNPQWPVLAQNWSKNRIHLDSSSIFSTFGLFQIEKHRRIKLKHKHVQSHKIEKKWHCKNIRWNRKNDKQR